MRKLPTAAIAALTIGAVLTAAVPASAAPYDGRGGERYDRHDHDGGAALAAGVVGLAIGAAIADGHGGYYGRSYYPAGDYVPYGPGPVYDYDGPPPAYYRGAPPYGYYGRCHTSWRWNPYWGQYTRVRVCF